MCIGDLITLSTDVALNVGIESHIMAAIQEDESEVATAILINWEVLLAS
jgi:hypothetical protein